MRKLRLGAMLALFSQEHASPVHGVIRVHVPAGWYVHFWSLVHKVDMMVTAAPTANNVMVRAELVVENKQGIAMCIFLQYIVSPLFLAMPLSFHVVVTSSWLCDFSHLVLSSVRFLESFWYSFVLFPAPRRWQLKKSGFRFRRSSEPFGLAVEGATRYGSGPHVARICSQSGRAGFVEIGRNSEPMNKWLLGEFHYVPRSLLPLRRWWSLRLQGRHDCRSRAARENHAIKQGLIKCVLLRYVRRDYVSMTIFTAEIA